jgi:hypothetical protein
MPTTSAPAFITKEKFIRLWAEYDRATCNMDELEHEPHPEFDIMRDPDLGIMFQDNLHISAALAPWTLRRNEDNPEAYLDDDEDSDFFSAEDQFWCHYQEMLRDGHSELEAGLVLLDAVANERARRLGTTLTDGLVFDYVLEYAEMDHTELPVDEWLSECLVEELHNDLMEMRHLKAAKRYHEQQDVPTITCHTTGEKIGVRREVQMTTIVRYSKHRNLSKPAKSPEEQGVKTGGSWKHYTKARYQWMRHSRRLENARLRITLNDLAVYLDAHDGTLRLYREHEDLLFQDSDSELEDWFDEWERGTEEELLFQDHDSELEDWFDEWERGTEDELDLSDDYSEELAALEDKYAEERAFAEAYDPANDPDEFGYAFFAAPWTFHYNEDAFQPSIMRAS